MGKEKNEIEFNYAWNWFKYHASQRMQSLNYFLIIIAGILYGISTVVGKNDVVLFLYCFLGLVISISFFVLDIRNEQLVVYGQRAIKEYEGNFKEIFRIQNIDEKARNESVRHKYWLKILYGSSIILFFCIFFHLILNKNIIIVIVDIVR